MRVIVVCSFIAPFIPSTESFFLNCGSIGWQACGCKHNLSRHQAGITLTVQNKICSDDEMGEEDSTHQDVKINMKEEDKEKPMTRLAMAAADWMEEEENDELGLYWGRYDNAKQQNKSGSNMPDVAKDSSSSSAAEKYEISSDLSTEELLDRYFERSGIDKRTEEEHKDEILRAMKTARAVSTQPIQAIRCLEEVRPYLQIKSRIGGNALLELGAAYEANEEYDKALEIYEALKENPERDIKRRVKRALSELGKNNSKGIFGGAFWFGPFGD